MATKKSEKKVSAVTPEKETKIESKVETLNVPENDKKEVLLSVRGLKMYFKIPNGFFGSKLLKAVDDVSFDIYKGETLGLVGESGCGKTTLGRTVLLLYNPTAGDIVFNGINVNEDFSCNKIKNYYKECFRKELNEYQDLIASRDSEINFEKHQIDEIGSRYQKEINIELSKDRKERNEQKIVQLKSQKIKEIAEAKEKFPSKKTEILNRYNPLINEAKVKLDAAKKEALNKKNEFVVKIKNDFENKQKDLDTKLASKSISEEEYKRLTKENKLEFKSYYVKKSRGKNIVKEYRKHSQIVFQDPYSSLDPRMTVEDIVGEPLDIHKAYKDKNDRHQKILSLLKTVGLSPEQASRYVHEFSGGQRQRIGIARSLAINPEFVVCDEPVSALDVSIQAQVINSFVELQKQLGLTYLFVAHNLLVVRHISDRIAVMYLGHIVELTESEELFKNPLHPYTKSLLSAIPVPDPDIAKANKRVILKGDIPSPLNAPSGCPFRTRCPHANDGCSHSLPQLVEVKPGHFVACHLIKTGEEKLDVKTENIETPKENKVEEKVEKETPKKKENKKSSAKKSKK